MSAHQIGQIYMLNSGGPYMTLVHVQGSMGEFVWFSPYGSATFPLVCVRRLTTEELASKDPFRWA